MLYELGCSVRDGWCNSCTGQSRFGLKSVAKNGAVHTHVLGVQLTHTGFQGR